MLFQRISDDRAEPLGTAALARRITLLADPQGFLRKHLINISLGLVLGAMTALFDYRALRAYAPIVYVGSLLGLVLVLSPLGSTVNGAQAWIQLPSTGRLGRV